MVVVVVVFCFCSWKTFFEVINFNNKQWTYFFLTILSINGRLPGSMWGEKIEWGWGRGGKNHNNVMICCYLLLLLYYSSLVGKVNNVIV